VGGLISVLAVNRPFMEKNPDAVQKLVDSYISVLELAHKDTGRWAKIYAEKAGLPEPVGPAGVRSVAMAVAVPVIAIGGVTAQRVPELVAAGAHGVAVVSEVADAADPAEAVRRLLRALGQAAA